ncbi:recombinase family protein [Nocardioides sp. Soil796]|uniref:recombinase family protein n=1 Tax=Nocardioides sp. Soil796 TaxID=1736412 RepID=UPI00138F2EED|nr:recombinase family protein [Nocardioides sp. Soil796]
MTSLRAAIYVRVSKNRTDDSAKPERQIKSCSLLGKAKGLTLIAEPFVDDDVSAYKGKKKRPQYEALLDLIKAGEVDVVLSWHIDRMLRTTREMLEFITLAEETGVSIESVQGGSLDLSTPAGRMVATILASVSQAEVEMKAERHLLKNEQTRQAGGSTGGPVPFGWTLGEKVGHSRQFIVDEDAAKAIKTATTALIEGSENLSQIARDWNAQGLRTTFDKPWNHNSLKKVLVRPRNAGLVEHHGSILEGVEASWSPLVSVEEWHAVCSVLDGQRRAQSPRKHLLSNLLTCAKCGKPLVAGMTVKKVKGREYRYEQYKHAPGQGTGCGASIERTMVDKKVRTYVRHILTFQKIESLVPQSHDLTSALSLRSEVAGIEKRMQELEDLWADGEFSTDGYKKQRKALSEAREVALKGLAGLTERNAFAGLLSGLQKASFEDSVKMGQQFDALSLDHRKTVVSALFPKIVIEPGRGEDRVKLYNADGEEFELT